MKTTPRHENNAAQIWEMIGALDEAESLDALFSGVFGVIPT